MGGYNIAQSTINSVGVAFVGAFLTFAMAWFWFSRNAAVKKAEVIAAAHEVLLARVAELETKERMAGHVMTPIVTAFQAILVKQLTHAGKPEMDVLMVKLGPPDTLTDIERARLMVMLHERTSDMGIEITASERDAARIMPIVMRMAAEEQANFGHAKETQDLKLLTVVSVVGPKTPAVQEEKDE